MRIAQIVTVALLTLCMVSTASAERRAGLGGKYTARNMTAAQGSLLVIGGPKTTQTLGAVGADGGITYTKYPTIDLGPLGGEINLDTVQLTVGAAYGITPELEAGLLLPVLLSAGDAEDFDKLSSIPLFATYAVDMGNFDVGGRVTLNLPVADSAQMGVTPGIPALFRFGNSRLDTGIFIPLVFPDEGDMQKTLSIPVRFSQSVTPKIFLGVETGLILPDIKTDNGAVPLSIFGGYTLLAGGNVIDLGASVGFPSFFSLAEGAENPITDIMQISVGANAQVAF